MKLNTLVKNFLILMTTILLLAGCGASRDKKDINGIWEWTRKNSEEQIGFDDYLYFEDNYFIGSCESLDDIQTFSELAKLAKSENKEFAENNTPISEIIKQMKKMAPIKGFKLISYKEYINFYEKLAKETDSDRDVSKLKSLEQVVNLFKNQGYTITENDIYCLQSEEAFALLEDGHKLGVFSFENRWSSKENSRIEIFTKYKSENNN